MSVQESDQKNPHLETVGKSINGAFEVSRDVSTILLQNDLNIASMPELHSYQQSARVHAKTWDPVFQSILGTSEDIISYAHFFNNVYTELLGLVDKLTSGTQAEQEKALSDFHAIFDEGLVPELIKRRDEARKVCSQVREFRDNFYQDAQNFQSSYKTAMDLISKDNQKICSLETNITSLRIKANELQYSILGVEGARVGAIACVGLLAVPVVGEILIGGMLALTVVDAGLLAAYVSVMHEISDKTIEMNSLKEEAAQLKLIEFTISNYEASTGDIIDSSDAIEKGWEVLYSELAELVNDAKNITPSEAAILIQIQLDAINREWQDVMEQMKKLMPDGNTILTKHYSSASEYLQEMQKVIDAATR